ncbi:MAG: threonine/serine dehydratase [Kutzneria sp.]|nr:threonine/serine dehydratase [Kutzneria sp.]MBV9847964.1 threonine/serine dehydratase [Kutzneria sp.]
MTNPSAQVAAEQPPTPGSIAERSEYLAPTLREHLVLTPLTRFDAFSDELGAEVLVKCEHQQRTGSFKPRGALAKILSLDPAQRQRGIVTASSGNHGLSVAYALDELGGHATVFVPDNASPVKIAAMRRLGADIRRQGTDVGVLEGVARAHAAKYDMVYVPPYNDPEVIAGQGTLAVEMLDQVGHRGFDAAVVSVGGGGLVSGVASVLKRHFPGIRIIGASPANDPAMATCVRAGRIVAIDALPTLSDGTAGNVEPGAVTVGLCRDLVDDWVLVDEAAIAAALRRVIDTEHQLIEGSAAVAFAAALARREQLAGLRVSIVSCGANISSATLARALAMPEPRPRPEPRHGV